MGRLEGKVIVLTAAAQGIGRASALVSSQLPWLTFTVWRWADGYQRYFVLIYCFLFLFPFPFFFPCLGFLLIFLSLCSLELNPGPQTC